LHFPLCRLNLKNLSLFELYLMLIDSIQDLDRYEMS
jgi:hypothetical protein